MQVHVMSLALVWMIVAYSIAAGLHATVSGLISTARHLRPNRSQAMRGRARAGKWFQISHHPHSCYCSKPSQINSTGFARYALFQLRVLDVYTSTSVILSRPSTSVRTSPYHLFLVWQTPLTHICDDKGCQARQLAYSTQLMPKYRNK